MTGSLEALAAAVNAALQISASGEPSALRPGELVALNAQLGRARRLLDATQASVAAEIARQSRPELGAAGLAKGQGFRTPNALIAATTGTTMGEASRLVQVGEAIAPRANLVGEELPAKHPHVAAALRAGRIGAATSAAIIALLDKVALRAGRDRVDEAEKVLAERAEGLSLHDLTKLLTRAEAWLDPDGIAQREDEIRAERSFTIREDQQGRLHITGILDAEAGAPVKVAVEAYVTAALRAQRDDHAPDAVKRSVRQMQADAVATVFAHYLGCDHRDLPVEGATVIVRMDLADLVDETRGGIATVDGLTAPISAATARRMAAGGAVIPCVLGGGSEILDWGRAKRLFTLPQKLALAERDGGCAVCGAPPSHTKAHHIRWWARDAGPTDLSNGVLLCSSCHHRVHDNGWDIRIEGVGVRAIVWLIPPAHVDPSRTPRRAGRARLDIAA